MVAGLMHIESSTFPAPEPNQNLLHKAYFVEQICLVLAVQIVLINLLSRVFPVVDNLLPAAMLNMRVFPAFAALSATLALFFTESRRRWSFYQAGKILAGTLTFAAALTFWTPGARLLSNIEHLLDPGGIPESVGSGHTVAFAFLLLGIVKLLLRFRDPLRGGIADAAAILLGLLVLILLFEWVFATVGVSGSSIAGLPSISTLVCLVLLTMVSILRRAEFGVFSVLLGDGIGGRIARILAPILLVVPFARELGRARLLSAQVIPTPYAAAILSSIATVSSFALLIFVVRLINNMQNEIHGLTLRDELTGLYNYRGFNLFADQAFRLSRRAKAPFGVLFIDMDNLKIINDELGHSAGSISLVETAKLLSATFRETDVIGRLGGDEFVVAGQFDSEEIALAIDRLRSGAAAKTHLAKDRFFLSLSMGYAASNHGAEESLKSLVSRADKAMYKEKRAKKRIA